MDPLHFAVASTPLAIYLLAIGAVSLSRRPRVTSGPRDTALLAAALSGLMMIGPLRLFVPEPAAVYFGAYVWLLGLSFYGLCVTLYILLARPRLVVYNQTIESLSPILENVAKRLDSEATWTGETLLLPQMTVQMHVSPYPAMRNVSLVALGDRQSFGGWERFERELRQALRSDAVATNPRGFSFVAAGLMLIGFPMWQMALNATPVSQRLLEFFRL